MLNPDQLEQHYSGIGGSMAPTIIGVNPFASAVDAYCHLTDPSSRPDLSGNQAVEWGNRLEDVIAEAAGDRLGLKLRRSSATHRHDEHHYMLAHVDRLVVGEKAGLEIKARSAYMADKYGEEGSDQVFDSDMVQCQHYMSVLKMDRWYLAVLLGGQDLRTFVIPRDEELVGYIVDRESNFWKAVQSRIPPTPESLHDLTVLYARDTGDSIQADSKIESAVHDLADIKTSLKRLGESKDGCELIIKQRMEGSALLTDASGAPLATWKTSTSKRIDVTRLRKENPAVAAEYTKESSSRRFLLKYQPELKGLL